MSLEWVNTLINILDKRRYLLALSILSGAILLFGTIQYKPALVHFDDKDVRIYFVVLGGIICLVASFVLLTFFSWLGQAIYRIATHFIKRRFCLHKYSKLSAPAQSLFCNQIRLHKRSDNFESNQVIGNVLLELQDHGFLRFQEMEGFHSMTLAADIYSHIFELFSEIGFRELEKMIKKDENHG